MFPEFLIAMNFKEDLFTLDGITTIVTSTLVLIALIVWIYDMIKKHW